jgi:hypothetical protein
MQVLRSAVLALLLATAACAPRPDAQILSPGKEPPPSGAPSAVPLPLPTYPYEPGFWV